tara:strand:+ start:7355 stop:8185 length:831 start_codon:yes stop_codon:yes gene_type:complete
MSKYKVAINFKWDGGSFFKLYSLDKSTFKKQLIDRENIHTMFLQFCRPLAILDKKSGDYELRDLEEMRSLAIEYDADFLILLSPYKENLKGKELLYCEDLREESPLSQSSEMVTVGVLTETGRGSYGYVSPYVQKHPLSVLFSTRFYRNISSSKGEGYEPLKKYVDQFKRSGRFYTGILDDQPTFDYLYVANKNSTALLVDRDGNETPISGKTGSGSYLEEDMSEFAFIPPYLVNRDIKAYLRMHYPDSYIIDQLVRDFKVSESRAIRMLKEYREK